MPHIIANKVIVSNSQYKLLCFIMADKTRLRLNIRGNFLADFILASLVWPQVLVQLEHEFKECIDPEDEEVKDVEA